MTKAYSRSKADSYQSSGSHELENRAINPSGASANTLYCVMEHCFFLCLNLYLHLYWLLSEIHHRLFFCSLPCRLEARKWHHQARRPEEQRVLLQALTRPAPKPAVCSRDQQACHTSVRRHIFVVLLSLKWIITFDKRKCLVAVVVFKWCSLMCLLVSLPTLWYKKKTP